MSFEVRNELVESVLKDLGRELRAKMPEGFGFTLMIFGYGEQKGLFYLSSARREDMIATMREFIEKHEFN